MTENPINCAPRYDRFLAVTETMPFGLEITRSIAEERETVKGQSIAYISNNSNIQFSV